MYVKGLLWYSVPKLNLNLTQYSLCPQPTYQNTTTVHEKIVPAKYTTGYGHSPGYTSQSPGYNNQSTGYNNQSTGYTNQSTGYTSQSPGYGRTSGRGNLSELDTLLDDLSNARYGNYVEKNTYTDRTGKFMYCSN